MRCEKKIERIRPAAAVLLLSVAALLFWYRIYFTSAVLPSVDLPAHIALAELFIEQWMQGRIQFYDISSYTGWPAMTFDGFLPYLVTGLLSCFCSWFSDFPVRLAAHLLLLFGVSLFPCSLYYAAKPLAREALRESDLPLAYSAAVFAFWFLNHDQQYYGIGAAAPMNIGLYPQLFGWHLFLLLCGALFRLINGEERMRRSVALWLALLAISHLQTFVFAIFLLAFSGLYFKECRRSLALATAVGVLTAGIYLAPCIALLGEFTAYDVHRPKGDLVQLFVRYPLYNLLLAAAGALKGRLFAVDPVHLLIPVLLFAALASPELRSRRAFGGLAVFILLATIVFGSGFVASSLPFGFHYYRFLGYLFILSTVVVTAVLASLLGTVAHRSFRVLTPICVSLFVVAVALLPHRERSRLYAKVDERYLADEREVLQQLAATNSRGRVYVEHLTDYKQFAPLSVHFIASRAFLDAGFETLANTFLQRSLAYRIFVESAHLLGAKTYNVPLLFAERASLDDETKLAQLRSFGVTHIVAGRERFKRRLAELGVPLRASIGKYALFQLQASPFAQIERVRKIAIGYIDEERTLPFRFLEYYFQGNQQLYERYELLELRVGQPIPDEVAAVIVNSSHSRDPEGTPYVRLRYSRKVALDHYTPAIPKNLEREAYLDAERYLSDVAAVSKSLAAITEAHAEVREVSSVPQLIWEQGNQAITVQGLEPGALYRINYSYFPFWSADDAQLFRGSAERMFLLPSRDVVKLRYSWWNHGSAWLGICMSFAGVLLLVLIDARALSQHEAERRLQ